MADLTDEDLAWLHSELGAAADEDDLQDRFDRLGEIKLVAVEVIRARLADLLTAPASFTVQGVYSENNGANIKALQEQLVRVEQSTVTDDGTSGGSPVVITRLLPRRTR